MFVWVGANGIVYGFIDVNVNADTVKYKKKVIQNIQKKKFT